MFFLFMNKDFIMHFLSVVFVLLFFASGQAFAATDEGLYTPQAPEGSAFVRFVNMTEADVNIAMDSKMFEPLSSLKASPYYVTQESKVELTIGDEILKEFIEPEKYYTVSITEDHNDSHIIQNNLLNTYVMEDEKNTDRSKATISFYNFQHDGTASLKAKQGQVYVFEEVRADENTTRDVNPIKIDLSVHVGNSREDFVTVEPFIMERGNHYSVFYDGHNAFYSAATVDTSQ